MKQSHRTFWTGILVVHASLAATLRQETLNAFEQHVRKTESRLEDRVRSGRFLWLDGSSASLKQVRAGHVAIAPVVGKGELHVPDGLVHHWVGAVFVPKTTVGQVLRAVQNYDNHKNTHKPEVLDSRLIARDGNDYRILLRVSKSKAKVTAVLNTEHDVHYLQVSEKRWRSRSYSTRITQIKNYGKASERELPPGQDSGFLWRLYSYWFFDERDDGVYVECEAVSLTRDVPRLLSLFIVPIIRDLPRESLENTLVSTRKAVLAPTNQAPRAESRRQ